MAQERGRHYELLRLGRTGIRSQTPAVAGYSAKGRIAAFDLSPSTPLRACPELAEGTGLSKAERPLWFDELTASGREQRSVRPEPFDFAQSLP